MPGQRGIDWIYAPHRVDDPDLERAVYGVGDVVPMADAIRYGLVDDPQAVQEEPEAPARPKGKRRPPEDRARRLEEER